MLDVLSKTPRFRRSAQPVLPQPASTSCGAKPAQRPGTFTY